ncbi:MAG TPA: ABC transporter permease [Anaerolineales bacterium]|nr:ABC transporter permease [Anaerolineales bacterium]
MMSEAAAIPDVVPVVSKDKKKVSQNYWSLVWWKFRRNRLAVIGAIILLIYYITCIFFAEFFAPYPKELESDYLEARPTYFQFRDDAGNFSLRPFVYRLEEKIDVATRSRVYEYDKTVKYPIYFFVKGEPYKLLGFIPADRHFFGTDPANPDAKVFLMGTDKLGRDQFSRILYGGRISLFIGLFSVAVFLFIGVTLGAISGYYGGATDIIVMRITELLSAFPQEPLFLALGAAVPVAWPSTRVFFIVTILLALVQWGGLARQVRGLVLSGREEQYVLAAQSFGASDRRIIFNHLIPATMSHVIVIATLKIPQMILLETALSFLGLGLVPPTVSWGTLLQNANTVRAISFAPWYLFAVPFILLSIMAYNMLGDGLRDAMDPYSK